MPKFGRISEANLVGVHPDLVRLARAVIQHIDCRVTDGERTYQEQLVNIQRKVSKTLNSKHLRQKTGFAHAMDMEPHPIDWAAIEKGIAAVKRVDPGLQTLEAYKYVGFVLGMAAALGIPVRAGHDWDGDNELSDNTFIDLPHFELKL